jgi:hypothetical protein
MITSYHDGTGKMEYIQIGIAAVSLLFLLLAGCSQNIESINYWAFDEKAGDSLVNSSCDQSVGKAYGTLIGQGAARKARYLYSSDSKIVLENCDFSLDTSFSIILWIGLDDTSSGSFFIAQNHGNFNMVKLLQISRCFADGVFACEFGPLRDHSYFALSDSLTSGFHQIAISYDELNPMTLKWYFDGCPADSSWTTANDNKLSPGNDSEWIIGRESGALVGQNSSIGIDELKVFNKALEDSDIVNQYMEVWYLMAFRDLMIPFLDKGWYAKKIWQTKMFFGL